MLHLIRRRQSNSLAVCHATKLQLRSLGRNPFISLFAVITATVPIGPFLLLFVEPSPPFGSESSHSIE
jgi:hypothetical protein